MEGAGDRERARRYQRKKEPKKKEYKRKEYNAMEQTKPPRRPKPPRSAEQIFADDYRTQLRESRAAPFAGVPMFAEYDGRTAAGLEPAEVRLRSFTSSPSRTPSRGASRNATPSPNTMGWRA